MKKLLTLLSLCILSLASYTVFAADEPLALPSSGGPTSKPSDDPGMSTALVRIEDIKKNVEDVREDLEDIKKDPETSSDLNNRIQDLIGRIEQNQQKMEQRRANFQNARANWQKGQHGNRGHHRNRGHMRRNIDEQIKNIDGTINDIDAILKDTKLDDKMKSDLNQLKVTLKKAREQLENLKSLKKKHHRQGRGRGGCRNN